MLSQLKYLVFGLLVIASYWFTVSRGYVFWSSDQAPSPPSAHVGTGRRTAPTFWSTGYQGGK
jgi:hypothetical protein